LFAWEPVVSRWSNLVFFTQTFTRWHNGIARAPYVAEWTERFGPLTPRESAAADRLRLVLQRGDGQRDGAALLAAVLPHDGRDEAARAAADVWPASDYSVLLEAVDAFAPRFAHLWAEAESRLRAHADALAGTGPPWLTEAAAATDRFFGIDSRMCRLRLYLLISAEGWSGGNGSMLTGSGGMTFECSGVRPQQFELLLPSFLHELMHCLHQPAVLPGLLTKLLAEPDLAGVEPAAYAGTAIGATGLSFEDYFGEVVLHSLWPDGALARRHLPEAGPGFWRRLAATAGLYDWWVFFPAGVLASRARTYVDVGREIDLDFLRHAYDIHATLRRYSVR
jgi:hypothetical protein